MCPAMTAPPGSPGRGLPVYQPATAVLPGTWSAPLAVSPSRISRVRTPMAGMYSRTGRATDRTVAGGTAAHWPAGTGASRGLPTGVAARPVWLATASPVTPAPARTSADQQCRDRGGPAYHPDGRDMPAAAVRGLFAHQARRQRACSAGRLRRLTSSAAADRRQQAGARRRGPRQHGRARPRRGAAEPGLRRADGVDLAALRVHQVGDAQRRGRGVQHDQGVDAARGEATRSRAVDAVAPAACTRRVPGRTAT